jgi:hypothetical protein
MNDELDIYCLPHAWERSGQNQMNMKEKKTLDSKENNLNLLFD